MNHLNILQSNGIETVGNSSNTIGVRTVEKLYLEAKDGLDHELEVELEGSILVDKAYRDSVEWLLLNTGLNIVITDDYYIRFADPEVARVLIAQYGDGTGVTETAAAAVTSNYNGPYFDHFQSNANIVTFDEMKYFTSITTLYLKGVYYSPQGVFQNCTSLETIDMRNITVVAEGSFWGCTSLRELKNFHPTSLCVDTRGFHTFDGCSSLLEVDCSNVVGTIPNDCFNECTSLNNIVNLNLVEHIESRAFRNCSDLQIDLNLPNYGSYSIGYSAFKNSGITKILDLGLCTSIGGGTYLGEWDPGAFAGCEKLVSAILPATLLDILPAAFVGCTALLWIKCLATTPPTMTTSGDSPLYSFRDTTCKVYVPDVSAYQSATGWDSLYNANRLFPLSLFSTDFPND